MEPLDLTQRPPRRVRESLAGVVYLARAIDKVRAELPGGKSGGFIVLLEGIRTLSSGFYRTLGIEHDEFVALVARARDDDEVGSWVRERASADAIEKWNATVLATRIMDVKGDTREAMLASHHGAAALPEDTRLVDMFDADDAHVGATARD